jgi:hypothetical protein
MSAAKPKSPAKPKPKKLAKVLVAKSKKGVAKKTTPKKTTPKKTAVKKATPKSRTPKPKNKRQTLPVFEAGQTDFDLLARARLHPDYATLIPRLAGDPGDQYWVWTRNVTRLAMTLGKIETFSAMKTLLVAGQGYLSHVLFGWQSFEWMRADNDTYTQKIPKSITGAARETMEAIQTWAGQDMPPLGFLGREFRSAFDYIQSLPDILRELDLLQATDVMTELRRMGLDQSLPAGPPADPSVRL